MEDALLEYTQEISVSPQINNSGMFGLGLFGSLVATVVLFYIIAYVIGGFTSLKRKEGWLIPNKQWLMKVLKANVYAVRAVMGMNLPRFVVRNDSEIGTLTDEEVEDCLRYARLTMKGLGITFRDAYRSRSFDCENFAMLFASLAAHRGATFVPEGKGVPIGIFAYTKKSGQGHVCVQANGRFYEPYPNYEEELELTNGEKESCDLDLM